MKVSMFSIIYKDRVIAVDYLFPVVGSKWRNYTIVEVNYASKAVWVA